MKTSSTPTSWYWAGLALGIALPFALAALVTLRLAGLHAWLRDLAPALLRRTIPYSPAVERALRARTSVATPFVRWLTSSRAVHNIVGGDSLMRTPPLLALAAAAALSLASIGLSPSHAQTQTENDPAFQSVFMVQVYEKLDNGHVKGANIGTGFFISEDGVAVTNSHVVYPVAKDPTRYGLLAIVGQEFYSASVLCSSPLPYDPTKPAPVGGVPLGRDIALIKLEPPTTTFSKWGARVQDQMYEIAHKHEGPLPPFTPLHFGRGVGEGDHIRVIGFGHISPLPYAWSASGTVDQTFRASDGTELFSVRFTSRPQSGNSGSPVLNNRGEVIGLWSWDLRYRSDIGVAQKLTAAPSPPACR